METRHDQPARDVLQLLAGLHEQIVAGWDLDWHALARVSRPDVQPWVARATVDGEKVKVSVKASEDGIFGTIFREVRSCRGEKMRPLGW